VTATPRPSLVFIHGTRLTGEVWAAQRSDLGSRYRVVTPDLPGHGTRAGQPFTLGAATEVIAATLRDEHGQTGVRPVLIGLSLGGFVAMDVAARHPELVGGLVIAGASGEPSGPLSLPILLLEGLLSAGGPRLQTRLNAWYFRTRYGAAIAEPIIRGGFWPGGGVQALRAIRAERFAPRLAAYPGPTLILNGDWDPFFRSGSRTFARVAVDARRVRLARATHLSNLDQPAAFDAAIERFVARLAGDPSVPSGPAEAKPGARLAATPDGP
jgi:pimeloyl-ACP methyl ester carboxylesterase